MESGGVAGRRVQSNEKFLEWLRGIQGEKRDSLSRGHSPDEPKSSSHRVKSSAPGSPGATDLSKKSKSGKRRKSLDADGPHAKRASGKVARKSGAAAGRTVRNKALEKVRGRRGGSADSREGSRKRGREEAEDMREDTPEPSLKGVKQSRRIASRKKEKKEVPILKMPKLQVQLSRQEIMDDFIAITGRRPQGKPKKSLILSYGLALCSSLQSGTTARYY
ncbi:hypothetical protein KFL_000830230 [Klebsormidium nitens]|uniref:Uncharacterized protein n=1 Tax=Klebsormidium nitens TaxID=105231 RepID=A0A1Y1HX44_KLENI|nr:hypothetical protein KFL_000830230 [Klebsormidium nitens]|eukprot:GAQ81541.1 hypothetical protein KFL_000830230 [Klebsormidium nitens]